MSEHKLKQEAAGKEIQLVVFRLAGEQFGLEISQVKEIIKMQNITPLPRARDFIEGVINLRGQIIGVMGLAKRIGLKSPERTEKSRIIVVEIKENTVGMIVDEVSEVLRISENQIDPTPSLIESQVHSEYIRGVGKLEDRLILLLMAEKMLSHEEVKRVGEVTQSE